jgi:hypothetical protein
MRQMDNIVAQRLAAVEVAPWEEYNATLPGSVIWGADTEWSRLRASSRFSYEMARAEALKP